MLIVIFMNVVNAYVIVYVVLTAIAIINIYIMEINFSLKIY